MGNLAGSFTGGILPPELLRPDHVITGFKSREAELDNWLTRWALHNADRGFSRTYVACSSDRSVVVGYYCLASGSVQRAAAIKLLQRNAPDPIPVLIIGRLAVDQAWERQGLGGSLLRDAMIRSYHAGQIAGVAALLVHCLNEEVAAFYHKAGFHRSPLNQLTMMLSLAEIGRALAL